MQKTNAAKRYQRLWIQTLSVGEDTIRTSDGYTLDEYDPLEWQDENARTNN